MADSSISAVRIFIFFMFNTVSIAARINVMAPITMGIKSGPISITLDFGSILAMSPGDVKLCAGLSAVVLVLFVFCYDRIFAVTFDESFARATGVNVSTYNILIAVLTAVTIVLGMQMMGAMMISSLIIFPALTSMRIFKSFRAVVWSSGIVAVVCFCMGMMASYTFSTPAGASVVLVDLGAFLLFGGIEKIRGLKKG